MSIRNNIVTEMTERLLSVNGLRTVFVNPKLPPAVSEFNCAAIVFKPDDVLSVSKSDDYPRLDRQWSLAVVLYLLGSDGTDETAEKEIEAFMEAARKEIYSNARDDTCDPCSLSGLVHLIYETTISEYIKPHAGEPGIGVIIPFQVKYTDDIAALFE